MNTEVEQLKALVAALSEAVVVSDSYGVQGSDFSTCLVCGAGGAPGVPFKHTDRCAAGKAEETAERWFREQREEIEDMDRDYTRFERALKSIANNTCCGGCQQAAKVAKAALNPSPDGTLTLAATAPEKQPSTPEKQP